MKPKGIVLHHSVTDQHVSVHTINKMHMARGWRGIGYHYLICKNMMGVWCVEKGRKEKTRGAHCPTKNDCLGICVAGNYQEDTVTPNLMRVLRRLCITLCYKYNWDSSRIFYHRQYRDTLCPGDNLIDWIPKLQEEIDGMLPIEE